MYEMNLIKTFLMAFDELFSYRKFLVYLVQLTDILIHC